MSASLYADLADRVRERFGAELREGWARLPEQAKDDYRRAAEDLARLTLERSSGRLNDLDAARELRHVEAALANLTFVAGEQASRAFWRAFVSVLGSLGEALAVLGTGVLRGLAKG